MKMNIYGMLAGVTCCMQTGTITRVWCVSLIVRKHESSKFAIQQ